MKGKLMIGMTALASVISACSSGIDSSKSTSPELAGQKVGQFVGSWLGYVPYQQNAQTGEWSSLAQTEEGRRIWGKGMEASLVVANEMAASGAITDLAGIIPTEGGTSTSGGLATSSSLGGASLATGSSIGAASLPTSSGIGGGSLPTTSGIGSGSISVDPSVFKSISASGGSSRSYLESVCAFIEGYFGFIQRCVPDAYASATGGLTGSCQSWLADAGITDTGEVPAAALTTVNCIADAFGAVACVGTDLVTPLKNAFSNCGVEYSSDNL